VRVRDENELRGRWGLPLDQPVGLFLGHAQPYRAFDRLLAALDHLPVEKSFRVVAVAGPPCVKVPGHERVRALGPVNDVATCCARRLLIKRQPLQPVRSFDH